MGKRGRPPSPGLLTPREAEVLGLIRSGASNADIAQTLNISIETVKQHVSSVLAKLGVDSREEASSIELEERPSWGRLFWALPVAASAVIIALVALLAWGVLRSENDAAPLPSPPTGVGKIAYLSSEAGDYDIWLVNTDGSDKHMLVDLDAGPNISNFRWSPDGEWLRFTASYQIGQDQFELWNYTVDPSQNWTRKQTRPSSNFENPPGAPELIPIVQDQPVIIGPDGTPPKIYDLLGWITSLSPVASLTAAYIPPQDWGGNGDTANAWIVRPDGTSRKVAEGYGFTYVSDWSYNGLWLAFTCAPQVWQVLPYSVPAMIEAPQPTGICFANAYGGAAARVTDGCNPVWTEDSRLIYTSAGTIRSIDTAGLEERVIAEYGGGSGTFALYQSGRPANPPYLDILC